MRLIYIVVSALLVPAFLSGCRNNADATSQSDQLGAQGHSSEITEPMTGVHLRVSVEDTEVDLAGVVNVRAELRWPDGVTAELIVPDWEEAGWGGSNANFGSIVFDGSQYSQVAAIDLEPFLDGIYEIPALGIRASTPATGRRIARLQPIEVVVSSALAESDDRTLDPMAGLAEPVELPQRSSPSWLLPIGISAAIVSACILLMIRMRRKDPEAQHIVPEAIIADTAASTQLSDHQLGLYHRALVDLSTDHPSLCSVAQEVERVRFSGNEIDHRRIQSSARHALETCGIGGTR